MAHYYQWNSSQPCTATFTWLERDMLVVCDNQARIRFYTAGWPESVHGNRTWRLSDLSLHAAEFFSDIQYLLGNSAFSSSAVMIPAFKKLWGMECYGYTKILIHFLPSLPSSLSIALATSRDGSSSWRISKKSVIGATGDDVVFSLTGFIATRALGAACWDGPSIDGESIHMDPVILTWLVLDASFRPALYNDAIWTLLPSC